MEAHVARAWNAGKSLALVAAVNVGVAILAPVANYWLRGRALSIGLAVAGVVTLFGLLDFGHRSSRSDFGLREAIAGSVIVVWLLLVSFVAFFGPVRPPTSQEPGAGVTPGQVVVQEQQRLITQQMLNNFTTTVGLIVAFYFGSQAIEQGIARGRSDGATPAGSTRAAPASPQSDVRPGE